MHKKNVDTIKMCFECLGLVHSRENFESKFYSDPESGLTNFL